MELVELRDFDQKKINNLLNMSVRCIRQFQDSHYQKEYNVYLVETTSQGKFVLKKISFNEYLINDILSQHIHVPIIPKVEKLIHTKDEYWLLVDYIEGDNLSYLKEEQINQMGTSLSLISSYFHTNQNLLKKLLPSFEEQ
ncbi:MAG: hypothetical protein RR968_00390, partial [Vagococcus sp.]